MRRSGDRHAPRAVTLPRMSSVFAALAPLALLVLCGAFLSRMRWLERAFWQQVDLLIYWIALPSLILSKILQAPMTGSSTLPVSGLLVGVSVVVAALCWITVRLLRRPAAEVGVLAQAGMRGNLAFVGLPVLDMASRGDAALMARAALVMAPTILVYNLTSVLALVLAQHRLDGGALWRAFKSMLTNPLLLACALGLLISSLSAPIPAPLLESLRLLGQTASPLALLSLGTALMIYPVGRYWSGALIAALIKLLIVPLALYGGAWLLGLPPSDQLILLVFGACPTAVASYVIASQLGGDRGLAAACIVLTTLLSLLSLGAVLLQAGS